MQRRSSTGGSVLPAQPKTFAELGVSTRTEQALRLRGIVGPFESEGRVIPDALAGRDVLARRARARARRCVRGAPRRAHRPRAAAARRADPGAHARAREPGDRGVPCDRRREASAGRHGLRRRGHRAAGQARPPRRHPDRHPGRCSTCAARSSFVWTASASACSTRPIACWTWGSCPTSSGSCAGCPDRQTMLFSATLDGEVGRLADAIHQRPAAARGQRGRRPIMDAHHRFICVAHPEEDGGARPRTRRRPGARAGVRADEARRRPARAHPPDARLPRGRAPWRHDPAGRDARSAGSQRR